MTWYDHIPISQVDGAASEFTSQTTQLIEMTHQQEARRFVIQDLGEKATTLKKMAQAVHF